MTPSRATVFPLFPILAPPYCGGPLFGIEARVRPFGGPSRLLNVEVWVDTTSPVTFLPRSFYTLNRLVMPTHPTYTQFQGITTFTRGEMWLTLTSGGIAYDFRVEVSVPEKSVSWLGDYFRLGTDFLLAHRVQLSLDAGAITYQPPFTHACGEMVIP
jgi:hypothetical protein